MLGQVLRRNRTEDDTYALRCGCGAEYSRHARDIRAGWEAV